jgi:hypothetical protein
MKPAQLIQVLMTATAAALLSASLGAQQGRAHAEAYVATLFKNAPTTLTTSRRTNRVLIEAIAEQAGQVSSQQSWVQQGALAGSTSAQAGLKTSSGRAEASYDVTDAGIGFGGTTGWYAGPTVSHIADAQIPKNGGTDVGAQARADRYNVFTYDIGGPTAETLELMVYGVVNLSVQRTTSPTAQMFASASFEVSHDDPDSPPFVAAEPTTYKLRKGPGVKKFVFYGQKGQPAPTLTKDAGQTIRITVKVRVEAWILDGDPMGLILARATSSRSPATHIRPERAWLRRRNHASLA